MLINIYLELIEFSDFNFTFLLKMRKKKCAILEKICYFILNNFRMYVYTIYDNKLCLLLYFFIFTLYTKLY